MIFKTKDQLEESEAQEHNLEVALSKRVCRFQNQLSHSQRRSNQVLKSLADFLKLMTLEQLCRLQGSDFLNLKPCNLSS